VRVSVRVCACVRGGDVRAWCLSYLVVVGDFRSALPPQLLSQIGALCTHVPPAFCPSYITPSSAVKDARKCDPNPPTSNWVGVGRTESVPGCCPSGT
jgi:hypothetical protein